MIQQPIIVVGKFYHSRCGNVVKLISETETVDENEKRITIFKGIITETIEGHRVLLNKTHWFDEKGKWLKFKGGIHDLVKMCDKH